MKHDELPSWRLDNIYPFIGFLIGIIINVVAITWWGATLSANQKLMVDNQNELKLEFKDWKRQAEARLGQAAKDIAVLQSEHRSLIK
jgi:uncharacterized membrane-anchored protein YhcB (DUF1043 family)